MKPITIARKVVIEERDLVIQFLLENMIEDEDCRGIPTHVVFEAYQRWKVKNLGAESKLTLHGFSKLLPAVFERKNLFNKGEFLKNILHVRLRDGV